MHFHTARHVMQGSQTAFQFHQKNGFMTAPRQFLGPPFTLNSDYSRIQTGTHCCISSRKQHRSPNKQTPWPESQSDRRLSTKLVPTFADIRCRVVSATNPSSCLLFRTQLYRFVRTSQQTHYVSATSPTG
jgi:hypothetical protein